MRWFWIVLVVFLTAARALGAEKDFDFNDFPLDQPPRGFRSLAVGPGKPGNWSIVLDAVPSLMEPLSPKAPLVSRQAVLAQSNRDASSDRFAVLVFEGAQYQDFKLTTRLKIKGGALRRSAGLVFRFENESNFYYLDANALEGRFRCSKVAQGEWKPPIGPALDISVGVWHELAVECQGTRIVCSLDGKELVKLIDSAGNHPGKLGFWTGGDTVAYFSNTRVTYTEKENLAEKLVRDALKEYSRLLDLRICAVRPNGKQPVVIASKNAKDIGQPGDKVTQDVINDGNWYFSKPEGKHTITIIAPLRDRNGDPIAAVCVQMESFPGQTEDNAAVRARPVVQRIQAQVQSLQDLMP
jgi:hypothetical protein